MWNKSKKKLLLNWQIQSTENFVTDDTQISFQIVDVILRNFTFF